jgi:hypothetical protein
MRKSKEQLMQERADRQRQRAVDMDERKELAVKQALEREKQRVAQAERRKRNATTRAGGRREGAGRPPKDGQERRTFTYYATYREREQVRNFLRVLRASDPQRAYTLFLELNGVSMYELLTSGDITDPAQRKIIAAEMPELLGGVDE